MEQMLADLLEISRYDAASALLDAEEHDLRPIITRVVEGCTELAQRQGVTVVIKAPERVAAEIDERRIERVIRNLVVNAIEHADGTDVTIQVASTDTDVACRVRDRGVGMTPGGRRPRLRPLLSRGHRPSAHDRRHRPGPSNRDRGRGDSRRAPPGIRRTRQGGLVPHDPAQAPG